MVHWTIIGTLLLCQMLCTIYQCNSRCWYSQKFPNQISFPSITPEGYLNQAATYIISILQSTTSVVPSLEYDDRTKNELVKISEPLGRATKNPTIFITSVTPTPTIPYISLPVKAHRVPLPTLLPPYPHKRVKVSQPTPPHFFQKKVITPKTFQPQH